MTPHARSGVLARVGADAYAVPMARGIGENPNRSPAAHLQSIEYPATREDIVQTAADNEAPADVINFFKSLPKQRYGSYEEVLRDFAEAERRFGVGNLADGRSREDIGKAAVEAPDAPTHHP
jgi:Protein of unknown function (DUF2795)